MKVCLVFQNVLEEELQVNISGGNMLVLEMERKLQRLLWQKGNWSVKKRRVLSKKQQK